MKKISEIEGKVAIVTGASQGIGAATAKELAKQGVSVVLAARNEEKLRATQKIISDAGGVAVAITTDVTSYSSISYLVNQTISKFNKIDILINNAGAIDPITLIQNSDPGRWTQTVDVNLKGVYFGIRAVSEVMIKQQNGVIINMSSGAANSVLEGWSHYCSAKAAVKKLTECANHELSEKGIRVVGLSPGTVHTAMFDIIYESKINPVSQLDPNVHIPVEWVAKAIAFLCTEQGLKYAGSDFSLKTEEGRRAVGLIT